jgi:hypothetical protein
VSTRGHWDWLNIFVAPKARSTRNKDFKIVLRITTYVSCRRHNYIIQIENRALLSNLKKTELSLKVS